MSKQTLLLAGVALLFAGAAQADVPQTQVSQASSAIAQKEAPAPTTSIAVTNDSEMTAAKTAEQELSPNIRPVYLDGGYFGGSQFDGN
jgi:hypothetical protein